MNKVSWIAYGLFSLFIVWAASYSFSSDHYVSLIAACAVWAIVTVFVLVTQIASSFKQA